MRRFRQEVVVRWWFLLLVGASVGCLSRGGEIDSAKAHRLVEGGALLVDVRTPEEYAAGHVDGAINVPVAELASRMDELGSKDRAVVVYCHSGNRSAVADDLLERAGFREVWDLGGMGNW